MTRAELEEFRYCLERAVRCRYWSWRQPQVHHPCLRAWPPGYLKALARWDRLPWKVRQLLAVRDHPLLEPGLSVWRAELGFDLALLCQHDYSESEFRCLASAAVGSMSFLRGLLWRADPEIARTREWAGLQRLLSEREAKDLARNREVTSGHPKHEGTGQEPSRARGSSL